MQSLLKPYSPPYSLSRHIYNAYVHPYTAHIMTLFFSTFPSHSGILGLTEVSKEVYF